VTKNSGAKSRLSDCHIRKNATVTVIIGSKRTYQLLKNKNYAENLRYQLS